MYDKEKIRENNLADRYVMGALSDEEKARFEAHFLNDPECLEELELAQSFQRDLRKATVEDAMGAAVQRSVLAMLLGAGVMRTLAASMAIVAVVALSLLLQRSQQLDMARQPSLLASLVLESQRSAGEPNEVSLTQSGIALDLPVSTSGQTLFRVAIHDAAGDLVWQGEQVNAGDKVSLALGRESLEEGDYRVTLERRNEGSFEIYGEYRFRIVK